MRNIELGPRNGTYVGRRTAHTAIKKTMGGFRKLIDSRDGRVVKFTSGHNGIDTKIPSSAQSILHRADTSLIILLGSEYNV